jgi:phosphoribosylamine--glycine ligase
MKILIVGGGGRENAIAWKIARNRDVQKLFCAPGNAGIAPFAECVDISPSDINSLKDFALQNSIDLTVVGPEIPLTHGIVDLFEKEGLKIFGPTKEAARLEGSKIFAKNIMQEAGIPTAEFSTFSDPENAKKYIREKNCPLVVKADGLAAGKGVFPCRTADAAFEAVDSIMLKKEFGQAGNLIVIEDFLEGEEASFICFTDGKTVLPLPSSQDHKPIFDGDKGPNTGGMGAYSPAPVITEQIHESVMDNIMHPLIRTLSSRGIIFKGIIYAGLMIHNNIAQVLEFNVRFGDPETQPILFRLESDLVELILAVIEQRLADITIKCDPRPAVCVVMASEGYPGTYTKGHKISGLDLAGKIPNTFVFHAGTALKDGSVVTNGGRVLGVTSTGKTIAEAITTVYTSVKKINWQGVQYRKDIAGKAL